MIAEAPGARAPHAGLSLLIVDDDFLFTQQLPQLLKRSVARPSLEVAVAQSPQQATETLGAKPFDIVLCDYDLRAARTGIDVLADAAQVAPPPLRILMTGHAPREIEHARPGAYDALIEKTMTLREMIPLVAALIHERLGVAVELHRTAV